MGEGTEEENDEVGNLGTNNDWFGRMVKGSRLARVVAGQEPSILPHYHRITPAQPTKPKITVEWEIMEWSSDDEDAGTTTTTTLHSTTTAKRKISEITTEGPGGVTSIMEVEMVGEEGDL
ncbi:hypothetical protein GP486_003617 [Trichoglossum hirsutum]|uniref:Uncharacterized protein n=1 Tax=Trichoglossum hirsutum TaxID=265104 RepID=A0A9P8LCQ9_9PEZI|nr:hypothetical protein GP486_003617 [Trichoglossum hirsutum]